MWSRKIISLKEDQTSSKSLPSYDFPGGYPIYYMDAQNCVLCADCATKNKDDTVTVIVDYGINYEDEGLTCDECSREIESAFGELEKLADMTADTPVFEDFHMADEE